MRRWQRCHWPAIGAHLSRCGVMGTNGVAVDGEVLSRPPGVVVLLIVNAGAPVAVVVVAAAVLLILAAVPRWLLPDRPKLRDHKVRMAIRAADRHRADKPLRILNASHLGGC